MTRSFRNAVSAAALATLVMLPLSPAGAAVDESQPESAQVTLRATGANWQPKVEFGSAVLTVSGPDDVLLRKEFSAGEAIDLNLADAASGGLPDGQYAWELVFSPRLSAEQKDRLSAARESGGDAAINDLKSKGKMPTEVAPSSGYFRVSGGNIVVAEQTEKPLRRVSPQTEGDPQPSAVNDQDAAVATKDQVFSDDLIVQGSECVGTDCVNGESFGFDTLRLKENNTRLKFDDTSNSASFPKNDWQLTANDSANGGAEKFSIDDTTSGRTPFTIEASARSNALYVESDGDVGFGTSNPVVNLHVVDGNTPTLRLEQDGSSGFTPQTWDVAGNEAGFFIRDATNGSTLPYRIRPGAPSSSIDIAGTGRVGIGTTSPDASLDVLAKSSTIGSGNAAAKFANSNGPVAIQLDSDDDGTFWNISSVNGDSGFRISRSGTGNTELELSSTGDLGISGDLTVVGGCVGCDAVFQPGYGLESIEDHASMMWQNQFLPGVGPTAEGKTRISVFQITTGMLNELEKAHIYIEQLHQRTLQQEVVIKSLEERLGELERAVKTVEK